MLVDLNVARAVHRFEQIFLFIDLHRAEHVFAVEIPMAGGFPEFDIGDVRRDDKLVAVFLQELSQIILDDVAERGAFLQPEDQAGTRCSREES